MADEYDKEAALLVCAVDFPVDKTRDRVAAALREAGEREADLQAEVNIGLQLTGSFFEALKPLNLQAINVQNPGRHVTDLIAECDDLRREKDSALKTERERVIKICKSHIGHPCDRDHTSDDCIESIIAEIEGEAK